MSLQSAKRRSYSEAEIAGAVLAVKGNRGIVKPVADKLGLHSQTLGRWVSGSRRSEGAADRALMVHKQEQELLEGYLELAVAAREQAFASLDKAGPYQATLISGISYDKYLLGTGRPTSRSETLRARYVEPGALRSLARTVLDLPALPERTVPQRGRGVSGEPPASHLAEKEKRPRARATHRSRNIPAGTVIPNPTDTQIQGRITEDAPVSE